MMVYKSSIKTLRKQIILYEVRNEEAGVKNEIFDIL